MTEPTQADIMAAAEYWNSFADEWNSWSDISGDEQDTTIEAFARHRLLGIEQGRAEMREEAALISDAHATNAWEIAVRQGQNVARAEGRNHAGREIAQAIRAIPTAKERG